MLDIYNVNVPSDNLEDCLVKKISLAKSEVKSTDKDAITVIKSDGDQEITEINGTARSEKEELFIARLAYNANYYDELIKDVEGSLANSSVPKVRESYLKEIEELKTSKSEKLKRVEQLKAGQPFLPDEEVEIAKIELITAASITKAWCVLITGIVISGATIFYGCSWIGHTWQQVGQEMELHEQFEAIKARQHSEDKVYTICDRNECVRQDLK